MNAFKSGWAIAGGVLAVLGLITFLVIGMFVEANNYGVKAEQSIIAAYDDNRNILSTYGKKVAETAQVPAMYRDDLTKVVSASMEGRYGADGSKAAFQWLKEMNIPFDSSLYKQIQQIIESGRNDFQVGQTKLIDQKRAYQTELGKFPRSMFMSILGFPKIDLKKYDIVSDNRTEAAFDTKREEAIQLLPQSKEKNK